MNRKRRLSSSLPSLRRSKRKRGIGPESSLPPSSPTQPKIPAYRRHTLGADDTFYLPDEVRPPPLAPLLNRNAVSSQVSNSLKPYKDISSSVCSSIYCSLNPLSVDQPASYRQLDWLTTPEGLHLTVLDHLQILKQRNANLRRSTQAGRVEAFENILRESQEAKQAIFSSVLNYIESRKDKLAHIEKISTIASARRAALHNAKAGGLACRKKATWKAVDRLSDEEVASFMGKSLVETQELADVGTQDGGMDSKDLVVLEGRGFHQICAPGEGQTTQATAVIFWEREDENDVDPSGEKIIGAVVYSPELVSAAFAPHQEYNEAEVRVNQDLLIEKSHITRARLVDGGKMAKGMGPQSSGGIPYFMQLPDDPKYYEHNVKIPIQSLEPFLLARHEAFLSGLLGEFAASRMVSAQKANLVNSLGSPSLSTFATYGYSASAHFDKDACPSSGWVTCRPASLHRYTSNFVWVSHGLIVELAPNAFWFWRARNDAHGTTVNLDMLQNPGQPYTPGHIQKNPQGAQWTRASVLTESVSRAHERGMPMSL